MTEPPQLKAWLSEACQGDELALSKLIALYHPTLRATVVARMSSILRKTVEPEDILQEVYLAVFRGIDRFEDRGPRSFMNWILTILDNKLIDAYRAIRCREHAFGRQQGAPAVPCTQSHFDLLDELYKHSLTPSRVVRYDEATGALLASMSRLTESHRQIIQLRFLDGCSVAEVAEETGKTEDAVVALTRRALVELRRLMDGLGEFTRTF